MGYAERPCEFSGAEVLSAMFSQEIQHPHMHIAPGQRMQYQHDFRLIRHTKKNKNECFDKPYLTII